MIRSAHLSDCGTYRYCLSRAWDLAMPALGFVMLNPSTADAEVDDPTVRKCIALAKREGYGGIMVANLFAYRATDPKALFAAQNPVGPANNLWIRHVRAHTVSTVVAWGAHAPKDTQARGIYLLTAFKPAKPLYHLGLNKNGTPKHPLYLSLKTPFQEWRT